MLSLLKISVYKHLCQSNFHQSNDLQIYFFQAWNERKKWNIGGKKECGQKLQNKWNSDVACQ